MFRKLPNQSTIRGIPIVPSRRWGETAPDPRTENVSAASRPARQRPRALIGTHPQTKESADMRQRLRRAHTRLGCAVLLLLFVAPAANAQYIYTWTGNSGGSWADIDNWYYAEKPDDPNPKAPGAT